MMDAVHMLVQPLGVQDTVTPVENEILQDEVGQDLKANHVPANDVFHELSMLIPENSHITCSANIGSKVEMIIIQP
jgi:hypothetical protein